MASSSSCCHHAPLPLRASEASRPPLPPQREPKLCCTHKHYYWGFHCLFNFDTLFLTFSTGDAFNSGFLSTLEPRISGVSLCRRAHATCSYSLDDKLQGELDDTQGEQRKLETVGAFQKIPMVMPATDILMSAQRKSRNVPPTKGIANIAKRERNKGAKQLDALMKELSVPLRTYTENFPKRRDLHPYERSLIELTFGEGYYEQSTTKREAEERLTEGRKKLEEAFQHGKHAIDDLVNVAKALRSMPVVDLHIPTLCLVGSPNVGKSSLVRILSSGKPEVCSYPFTTRGILMGHIVSNQERFQVTDTPGLLTRHDDDRNNIERLTLAVLSYLPIAVLYVHDLSEDCGTSVADQYITYKHIKDRFGDRLWLDVISKCDLLGKKEPISFHDADEDVARYRRLGPEGALQVSVQTEIGVKQLKERVHELLTSQMARIKSSKAEHETHEVGTSVVY
ncbi:P-loop containing nucleoside triphosphate hydrolase superfamily protein [Zea mays]|uniref:p-loop containing nucleoside triphosphate hydrolase superfamily protein n=1 Tax=Zea mays TaxID=4577 RepID=A0A1D6J028_MAIZE|nr:P-loop containing nucleoside triphosphate hydrolase superfamily protein [Zea mays]